MELQGYQVPPSEPLILCYFILLVELVEDKIGKVIYGSKNINIPRRTTL